MNTIQEHELPCRKSCKFINSATNLRACGLGFRGRHLPCWDNVTAELDAIDAIKPDHIEGFVDGRVDEAMPHIVSIGIAGPSGFIPASGIVDGHVIPISVIE